MRGLKPSWSALMFSPFSVAPHVGAWIETFQGVCHQLRGNVAPHVGAWIETVVLALLGDFIGVAPHVGAWIETFN